MWWVCGVGGREGGRGREEKRMIRGME